MPVNPEGGKIWLPPGVHTGEHLADPRSPFPRYTLPISTSPSLTGMAREYAFFSLGIPMRLKTFNDAYLHDLASTQDRHFKLYVVRTQRPVFRGLEMGHATWLNTTIWAVGMRYWKATANFFLSVGLLDRIKGHYYKYMEQEFLIPDPVSGGPNMLKLTVTAVNSTRGQFVGRRAPDGVIDAIKLPTDSRFATFGAAVIAGHPNPMSLIEDNDTYRVPDKPFQAPVNRRMDELSNKDRRYVIQSIEEMNNARARGEYPKVRW